MASYFQLMEQLALGIHTGAGGDTQSTTTCGYYTLTHTLYITSQSNWSYDEVLVAEGAAPTKNVFDGRKKLNMNQDHPHIRIWLANFGRGLPEGKMRKFFAKFEKELVFIKVVMDQDLFWIGKEKTGFHGESRVIRHLLLKYLRNIPDDTDEKIGEGANAGVDLLSEKWSREKVDALEAKFKELFSAGELHFGSSQGACTYCKNYMTHMGIKFGSEQQANKNRDDDWKNPITMTATRGKAYPEGPVTQGLYAPRTASDQKQAKAAAKAAAIAQPAKARAMSDH